MKRCWIPLPLPSTPYIPTDLLIPYKGPNGPQKRPTAWGAAQEPQIPHRNMQYRTGTFRYRTGTRDTFRTVTSNATPEPQKPHRNLKGTVSPD